MHKVSLALSVAFLMLVPNFAFANKMPGLGDYFMLVLPFALALGVVFGLIFGIVMLISYISGGKKITFKDYLKIFGKLLVIPPIVIIAIFLEGLIEEAFYHNRQCFLGNYDSTMFLDLYLPVILAIVATVTIIVKFFKQRKLKSKILKNSYFKTWLKVFSISWFAISLMYLIGYIITC